MNCISNSLLFTHQFYISLPQGKDIMLNTFTVQVP